MIVRRLRVQRFGCLDDLTVAFGPGLNIVCGPNESGKSTLQRALLRALLDRPAKRKSNEDDRQWGAPRLFRLEVEFETAGGRCWSLVKDYQENKARLWGAGDDTAGWEEIQGVVSDTLGTASAQMLQSTCCIAQDELAAISDGRKELCQSLESMVTGGDDDSSTADAIAQLQKAILGLRRGLGFRGAANPGRLAVLAERKGDLEALAASHRAALVEDDRARQRLAENHDRRAQLETEMRPRLAARRAADKAFVLEEQLIAAREREATLSASLERIAAAAAAMKTAVAALADPANPVPSEPDYHDLTCLHERVALLRSQMEEMAASSSPPGVVPWFVRPGGWQRLASLAGAPALLLLLSIGIGTTAATYGVGAGIAAPTVDALVAWSTLFGVLAAAWLAQAVRKWHGRIAGDGRFADARPGPSLLALQTRLEGESSDLDVRLRDYGCADWAALEERQQGARRLRAQRDEAQARMDGLLPPGRSWSDLEESRRSASLRRRDLEEALAEPACQRSLQFGPIEYQSLCQETDRLTEERQDLERESIGLQARLDAARVTKEDLIAAEEQLAAASIELLRLQETLSVYEMARDTLQTAWERTLVKAQGQLAPRAGAYLAELTGGRYTSIIVDSQLNVAVAAAGNPEGAVEPRRLSKGTQDQVYLAVRLALMDLLFPTARPPLFLDDPFVKFDAARRTAALQLCQRIAQQRQVILFTCSDEYARWGQGIAMPAPTARAAAAAAAGSETEPDLMPALQPLF